MSNITITDVCNLSCPYCFNSFVTNTNPNHITTNQFEKIVDFILTGNTNRIGFIGGEPTLHPELGKLFEIAREKAKEAGKADMKLLLFTNGILLDRFYDEISKFDVDVLINVNSPNDIGEKMYEKLQGNLASLGRLIEHITLGINFYNPDMDTRFILDLLKQYRMKELRLGLPAPTTKEEKEAGMVENMLKIKPAMLNFIHDLNEIGVHPHFDCQAFPKCVLLEDEIEFLKEVNIDLVRDSCCTPVIDFTQDGSAIRCFGLSADMPKVNIKDFASYSDLDRYFFTSIDVLANCIPATDRCSNCYLRKVGRCSAGCLSYKADAIKSLKKVLNRAYDVQFDVTGEDCD